MKVLIITYYWPPAGGSGVQRWLKFVKYIQGFGIEPIVYTVDSPNYEILDESLIDEIPNNITILKQPIFEPNNFLKKKKIANANVSSNPSFVQKSLQYIRGNYFIPDARKFWVKPSVNYLEKYLNDNPIDVIVSTGPPHSMHLIGMKLKQNLGVKWLADFRDPMSNLFYNNDLLLTEKSKDKLNKLEIEILSKADKVITVSNHIKKEFEKHTSDIEVITNGYDDEVLTTQKYSLDNKFTLSHIGLLPYQSNPKVLWQVLNEIVVEDENFAQDLQINLVGNISEKVIDSLNDVDLMKYTSIVNYIPHSKAIEVQKKSQVLLLLIPQVKGAEGILTGKVFEYIASNRPIVALAPKNSDLIEVVEGTNTGSVIEFTDAIKIKTTILELYKKHKEGNLSNKATNIDQYHRRNLTKKLAQILSKL